jgi:glycine/D-amino acid oxidase-like deaminating enzyme
MRLVSGAPYWLVKNGLDEWPVLPPQNCQVAVVGAGLAGAVVADAMTNAGYSVTVLDRRAPAAGSTAANTGLVTYELDVELAELADQIGEPFAARGYRAAAAAVETLAALISTLPDDCGFARRTSLYLAERRRDARRFEREAGMRQAHGIDVRVLDKDEVLTAYGFPSHGALSTTLAASVDPVRLTRALLERAESMGAVICPRTTVLTWTCDGHRAQLETTRGNVTADWVILATGYETPSGLRNDLVALHSTYALVTVPVDHCDGENADTPDVLVWDTARPYSYLRPAEDGRIIIGGEDVPFRDFAWRDRLIPGKTHALEKRLGAFTGGRELETEFVWAGTFGETRDGMPCIGPVPGMPRVLAALGYGGNGIVFSVIASRILRDIVLGEGHEDAELFSLDRDQTSRRSAL